MSLPEGWAATPLGALVDVLDGHRIPVNATARAARAGNVPYYGATGPVGTIDEALFNEDLVLLGEDGVQFFDPHRAKAYRIRGPAWVNNHAHVLRARAAVDWRFLEHYLNHFDYRGYANGTTRLKLTQAAMNRIPVLLPRLDEQRRIVEMLEDHLSRLDAAEATIRVQVQRLTLLRLSSLSSARRELLAEAEMTPIGSFAETSLGKMLDAKRAVGEPTPYLRNINVRWGAFDLADVLKVALTSEERRRLELRAGDLLVCEGGEPGRCAVWPGSQALMTYQKALHRVRVRPETALPEYVAAMVEESIRSGRVERLFTGTTIKHLPQEKLRQISLPLPNLEAQQAVINRVARLTEALDRLRSQLDAAVARSASLRRSLLSAAFSGRLTNPVPELEGTHRG